MTTEPPTDEFTRFMRYYRYTAGYICIAVTVIIVLLIFT